MVLKFLNFILRKNNEYDCSIKIFKFYSMLDRKKKCNISNFVHEQLQKIFEPDTKS